MKTIFSFVEDGEHILYDRYSNEFLSVEEEILNDVNNDKSNNIINKLQLEFDMLKPFSIPEISLSEKASINEKIIKKINQQVNQLCFITTEECNLRCEYCVYSGSYENRRSHNNLHEISIETARKAIDLFVKIATNKSARTIIFYGGESLMAFNVIKDIVDYANSLEEGISFAMNTNLTLLTPEIITFLVKNDFRLTVSLDGPEKVHDLYRVYRNKRPTHQIVERNLWQIRNNDEKYFIRNMIFNVLIVPHQYEMNILDSYFSGALFKDMPIDSFIVLTLNPEKNSFSERVHYGDFLSNFDDYSTELFINRHIAGGKNFSDIRISYNYHIRAMKMLYFRKLKRLDDYAFYWPNGICILGLRSMVVTSKGELYPCEEMYDSHQLLIGDVDKGIDANTILKTTVEYINKANTLCKDCWAYRFCPHCFTSAFVDGHYSMNRKISECKRTKKNIENNFKMYLRICKSNPNAFRYLDDVGADEMYYHMLSD